VVPEHYQYKSVQNDILSCKIFKTEQTKWPASLLNIDVAPKHEVSNKQFSLQDFSRQFPFSHM